MLQESPGTRYELPGVSPCLRSEKTHVIPINYISARYFLSVVWKRATVHSYYIEAQVKSAIQFRDRDTQNWTKFSINVKKHMKSDSNLNFKSD